MTDDLAQHMHTAAASRAAMWEWCARILSRPAPDLVTDLREGIVADELVEHTQWLGESVDVSGLEATLRAHARRSVNRSEADDLADLDEDWQQRRADDLAAWCSDASAAAAREAALWESGQMVEARTLRAEQHQALAPQVDALTKWCVRTHTETQVLVMKVLAEIVALHIGVEAGRDVRGLLHEDPKRRFLLGG